MSYELYCFHLSGNAYKVALMLTAAKADWQPRWVDFLNGETRSAEYRQNVNEQGEVPVLVHDGKRLSQSGAILDYLAKQTGQFGAANEEEAAEIWRWILWDNHKFTSYTATYRFMKNFMQAPSADVLAFLHGRAKAAWDILNKHLEGKEFVVGNRMTIADFSLAGYVYFDDEIGVDWANEYPHIAAWKDRIQNRIPGWKHPYEMMPGKE